MEAQLFNLAKELLSTGSDAATIAIVYIMWRLDRRIFVLENKSCVKKSG